MVVVSAVAFVVGALCLYYGARALRTERAIRRLGADDGDGMGDPLKWLDPPGERLPEGDPEGATNTSEETTNGAANASIERGFILVMLGALCLLIGAFAL
ncbi:MAG: hypothetical protein ABEK02_00590 [Haloquadratum sp.]